ncbi:MAG TPA: ABC transporter permease [Gammaproteobacteria bacterium]
MNIADRLRFAFTALRGAALRSLLMLIAMAIGVASVVILTGLGEGARRYVVGEFASLGTNLLIVLPGRNETTGGAPPLLSETPRDLTLDDATALLRSRHVRYVAPINVGAAAIAHGNRDREAVVMGATASLQPVRHLKLAQGQFLPELDAERAAPVCVIGAKIREELFGAKPALGEGVRIGDRRFRVIGVLAAGGQSMGTNTDELVVIPVASAQQLFNTETLFRILIEVKSREEIPLAQQEVSTILRDRHDGEEDVTVITQDAILATFDRILSALTYTVGGIGAISLLVAGILIMNVMLVAVTQRTSEIGLLKAVGATGAQVLSLFLIEAVLLSLFGALIGLLLGALGAWSIHQLYPLLPTVPPLWAVVAALLVAITTGVLFGALPARRAARLDPVLSLARR